MRGRLVVLENDLAGVRARYRRWLIVKPAGPPQHAHRCVSLVFSVGACVWEDGRSSTIDVRALCTREEWKRQGIARRMWEGLREFALGRGPMVPSEHLPRQQHRKTAKNFVAPLRGAPNHPRTPPDHPGATPGP